MNRGITTLIAASAVVAINGLVQPPRAHATPTCDVKTFDASEYRTCPQELNFYCELYFPQCGEPVVSYCDTQTLIVTCWYENP